MAEKVKDVINRIYPFKETRHLINAKYLGQSDKPFVTVSHLPIRLKYIMCLTSC